MLNLLTGKRHGTTHPQDPNTRLVVVEEPWTAEAHLAAMRRLLEAAGKNTADSSAADVSHLLAAARIHAEAAKSAGRTPLPAKTAPARTTMRDGDTL